MRLFNVTKRHGPRGIFLADYMHVDINGILRLYQIRSENDDFLIYVASRDAWEDCEDRGEVSE